MDQDELFGTVSTEYKDISLLLLALTRGATAATSFYSLALGAFGLSYSATPEETDGLLSQLKEYVLKINAETEIAAESAEAVSYAAHALFRRGKWCTQLQRHEKSLVEYFERIDQSQWLRSPTIACTFLLGFANQPSFQRLVLRASAYLAHEVQQPSSTSFPVALFGLSRVEQIPQFDDLQVQQWLDLAHKPFKHLSMLAVGLTTIKHRLASLAVSDLRRKVLEVYSRTIDPNIGMIRILLAIIHMAEMGQNAEQITATLDSFPIETSLRERVSAVIRADARLFIEFRDSLLVESPTLEFLSFYLFASMQVGLANAYIVSENLEPQFLQFLAAWKSKKTQVVDQVSFKILILISLAASITALIQVWWPVSNKLYAWSMQKIPLQLVQSYFDDILKWFIMVPIYFIFGSGLALWQQGQVGWNDIRLEGILKSIRAIFTRQAVKQKRE